MPWTLTSYEMDIPPGVDLVSAWFMYSAPAQSELGHVTRILGSMSP